jgi:lysozyme
MNMPLRALSVLATLLVLASCGPTQSPVEPERTLPLAPGAEGIDLSHHNGPADWPLLSVAGLDFVYLKATEGEGHVDTRFQENWQGAVRHHWQAGAYHFYLLCQDGRRQAANFIRQVEVRAGALPPAVDLEHAHNCAPRGSRTETLADLQVFLTALEEEYGAVPVIYTTPAFHAEWLAGEGFDRHPLWIRSLDGPPDLPYAIWQYSMKGKAPGLDGPVDLNRAAD